VVRGEGSVEDASQSATRATVAKSKRLLVLRVERMSISTLGFVTAGIHQSHGRMRSERWKVEKPESEALKHLCQAMSPMGLRNLAFVRKQPTNPVERGRILEEAISGQKNVLLSKWLQP